MAARALRRPRRAQRRLGDRVLVTALLRLGRDTAVARGGALPHPGADSVGRVAFAAEPISRIPGRHTAVGADKNHSAVHPHGGPDHRIYREVSQLGATLRRLAEVAASRRAQAQVALLFVWESWW